MANVVPAITSFSACLGWSLSNVQVICLLSHIESIARAAGFQFHD